MRGGLTPLVAGRVGCLALRPSQVTRGVIGGVWCDAVFQYEMPLGRDQDQMFASVAAQQRDHATTVNRQCFDKFKPTIARADGATGKSQIVAANEPQRSGEKAQHDAQAPERAQQREKVH
ncbi:hypothetical protein [Novosphingobium sp. Rr 2-17]|uniref:hypothetical protein n=1 Tax=Novosphingobium sp. Rr 2-17 TaxID=555793 RepID=UPI000694D320